MPQVANRVRENTSTTGTGAVTVSGATSSAFRTFASANLTHSFPYYINDANGNWEEGRGTYSGGVVTRAIVEDSSIGPGKPISLSGNAVVGIDLNAGMMNDMLGEPSAVPPSAFPNLVLWLDAANATPSQWTDTSGAGNNATQATAANQPTITASAINGLPAVSFNGTSSYYDNAYTGEIGTVLIVYKTISNVNGHYDLMGAATSTSGVFGGYYIQAFNPGASTYPTRRFARCTGMDTGDITSWSANSSPVLGCWNIFGGTNDGAEITLYNNSHQCGSPSAFPNSPPAAISTAYIGCSYYSAANQNFLNGEIAEIVVYSSALTQQQFRQVEAWLEQKYALQDPVGEYLWTCFQGTGNSETGANESLVMLVSNDGLTWNYRPSHYQPPNNNAVRDVSPLYYNGALWIVHTTNNGPPSDTFTLSKSTDGFNFYEVMQVDCSAITGTTSGSAQTWAPKFFQDGDGSVHVFVALSSNYNVSPPTFQLCEVHPTNSDWTAWSPAVAVAGTSLPTFIFDPDMTKIGTEYYLWFADQTSGYSTKAVEYMSSSSLLTGYAMGPTGNWAGFGYVMESPCVINTGPTSWRIYLDNSGDGYLTSTSANNFSTWTAPVAVTAPFTPQHGDIILMPQSFFS